VFAGSELKHFIVLQSIFLLGSMVHGKEGNRKKIKTEIIRQLLG
jgi:hypothetical protein